MLCARSMVKNRLLYREQTVKGTDIHDRHNTDSDAKKKDYI